MAPQAHRAQTLKQAKAAYKSRNGNTLTEREKKQLERSIELDRRAWRAREAEKRKAEAKAKRDEKEREGRESGVGMTSQRRCDRFGFVASQMRLGAFFGGGGGGRGKEKGQAEAVAERKASADEDCFDGDLDDESMLDVVDHSKNADSTVEQKAAEDPSRALAHTVETGMAYSVKTANAQTADLDFSWDDLDSSTQIARDLASEAPAKRVSKPTSPNTSFSSGEFDLSVEDIEDAQAKGKTLARFETDKNIMPPPSRPIKLALPKNSTAQKQSNKPSLPQKAHPHLPPGPSFKSKQTARQSNTKKPAFEPYLGFTMAELESFVDDDVQLTQVDPV